MVTNLETMAQNAKLASYTLASLDTLTKNKALDAVANKIEENKLAILQENAKDLKKAKKLDEILEIPVELSTNNPKITILGFERLLIENYRGILEYQDYFIRVNTYIGIININGFNLNLEEMTTDDLLVTGKIETVDFEEVT